MNELSYNAIKHLIYEEVDIDGTYLKCKFKDKDSDEIIQSVINVSRLQSSKSELLTNSKREIKSMTVQFLSNLVNKALGYQWGSSLSRILTLSLRNNASKISLTNEDKNNAVVEAFRLVSTHFYYDPQSSRWRKGRLRH